MNVFFEYFVTKVSGSYRTLFSKMGIKKETVSLARPKVETSKACKMH